MGQGLGVGVGAGGLGKVGGIQLLPPSLLKMWLLAGTSVYMRGVVEFWSLSIESPFFLNASSCY